MPTPPRDPPVASTSSGESASDSDAPPSSGRVLAADADAPPPPSGLLERIRRPALIAFLESRDPERGRAFIKSVIVGRLGSNIDSDLSNELIQLASLRALKAQKLPWTEAGVPAWLRRVTKRAMADYFDSRRAYSERFDKTVDDFDPRDTRSPPTDWGAREHLIAKWLEREIGADPFRRETFRLILEHEVAGKTLAELAIEYGTTERALANRFHKLRKRLVPRVALMDDEQTRRTIFFVLALLGLGAAIALVFWLLHVLAPAPAPPPPLLSPLPAPTASAAPAPSFDQALPPEPTPGPSDHNAKPQNGNR